VIDQVAVVLHEYLIGMNSPTVDKDDFVARLSTVLSQTFPNADISVEFDGFNPKLRVYSNTPGEARWDEQAHGQDVVHSLILRTLTAWRNDRRSAHA